MPGKCKNRSQKPGTRQIFRTKQSHDKLTGKSVVLLLISILKVHNLNRHSINTHSLYMFHS